MESMPPVSRCEVMDCFYNRDRLCHAPAITVGSTEPCCDTYLHGENHIGRQSTGMVGACHVSECKFNADMLCNANGITVAQRGCHADCDTFTPRS